MVLDFVLRVSWICILLFGRGSCFPVLVKGQSGSTGRFGQHGWVPGTGGVGAVRWLPGAGLLGGGNSGSVRVGTGDWTSGAGRSGTLNVGTTGVGRDASFTTGLGVGSSRNGFSASSSGTRKVGAGGLTTGAGWVGAGSFSTSGVDLSSSVAAGVGTGSSGGAGTVGAGSSGSGGAGTVGAGSSGSGGAGTVDFTGSSFFAGVPWVNAPAGGAPSFFDPQNWMPSQTYPGFNGWYTYQVPLGMFMTTPALPSSYIIQNGNGYQRGREAVSYSKYTDDIYSPFAMSPVLPSNPGGVP